MSDHCPSCGTVIESAKSAPRSVPQLRRYFAMIKAFHAHWPERCPRQFATPEEMRKYAQIRAGHFETGASIPIAGMTKERAMLLAEAAIRAADAYAECAIHGDTLTILKPKSIRFDRLSHIAACRLFDEVAAVLEAESGIKTEDVMRHQEQAA